MSTMAVSATKAPNKTVWALNFRSSRLSDVALALEEAEAEALWESAEVWDAVADAWEEVIEVERPAATLEVALDSIGRG
jgi:hypothetical protein